MGARALVQFYGADETSPVVYLHWNGHQVPEFLVECRELMDTRTDDASYAAARFIGICHSNIPGNLSLGVWNNNQALSADDSQGDFGVFGVDVSKVQWIVENLDGEPQLKFPETSSKIRFYRK
jgi:hypothetical protein